MQYHCLAYHFRRLTLLPCALLIATALGPSSAHAGGTAFDQNQITGTAGLFVGGGAIGNLAGTLTIVSGAFTDNSTATVGGALFNNANALVRLSIFLGNEAPEASRGYNLSSDTHCGSAFTQPGDMIGVDAKLKPLASNGGPTMTYLPLAGSPAIDAAVMVSGITTDQRGVKRPQGANPDIGSVEAP